MARISGVDIPRDKHVVISLTYIYGIGKPTAEEICKKAGVDQEKRVKDLSEDELRDVYGIEVGDFVEKNGLKYYLVDLDGNNYEGFVFMYQSCISHRMNSGTSNSGGYKESELAVQLEHMYQEIQLTDKELYTVIKPVTVVCTDGQAAALNGEPLLYLENAHMFVPGYKEIGLTGALAEGSAYHDEGDKFDFFVAGGTWDTAAQASRATVGEHYSTGYWLRSTHTGMDNKFYCVLSNGVNSTANPENSYSIVACFVIG